MTGGPSTVVMKCTVFDFAFGGAVAIRGRVISGNFESTWMYLLFGMSITVFTVGTETLHTRPFAHTLVNGSMS